MNASEFRARLAGRLAEHRRAKGLERVEVAERTGISLQNVCNYEAAKHIPRADLLYALARTLGVSMDDLCREDRSC